MSVKNLVLDISSDSDEYLTECVTRDVNMGIFGDHPGVQYKFMFPNGYGASVIKTYGSYGYDEDLWEMALLDSDEELIYVNDFEFDVIGNLSTDEVNELLTKIRNYEEVES